jgi:hypothetical protein
MVSQKAAFNRNLTALPFPWRLFFYRRMGAPLADRLEEPVRLAGCICASFEANSPQIF